jgi:hypothetical protein
MPSRSPTRCRDARPTAQVPRRLVFAAVPDHVQPMAKGSPFRCGYRRQAPTGNLYSWLSSAFTAGRATFPTEAFPQAPFGPSLATSAGIIVSMPTSTYILPQITLSRSPTCSGPSARRKPTNQSRPACSSGSSSMSTPPKPYTASLVALRCWASSF